MNRRNAYVYITVITLFLLLFLCGTVKAYMVTQTGYQENRFIPAQVSCAVQEITDENVTEKSSIKILNTGNIDVYLRIRFASHWVQTKEGSIEIVGKASEMPEISFDEANWVKGSGNTYYYKSRVPPNALTGELLTSGIALSEADDCKQVVEVFAEAIQSLPTSAVTDSWNVTLDGDGNILTAP